MAIVYLEPDDLSAAQQARVLRVLNLAADTTSLAAAIEIPGEPDIGLKLAERLLRARAGLNGQFTALTQVLSVPYLGPERFTDLCVAILGLQREQLAKLGGVAGQRLASASVSAYAGADLQVQIEVQPQPAWIGQTLQLVLRVRQNGTPLINRTLTLETSLGQLSHCFGFARQSGCALQLRTGADGTARLQLDYQPDEPLTQDQDNALQLALEGLDTSADTPDQIRVAFNQLAAEYDDERNIHLRHALDIYSRHGQAFWTHFNAHNAEFEWPRTTAVLRAYLHAGSNSQGVMATAVTLVRWINWVPAWFNFLHDWLANRAELPARLAAIKRKGLQGYALVDNLIGEAHSFVAGQKGFAAELVSQHLVSDSVKRFLSTELDDVPDDTKRMLFPNLELAAEQIRAGNRGSLELVANTRGALKADIADIGRLDAGVLAEMRGLRDEVNVRANGIREQLDTVTAERIRFEEDFGSRYATFNSNYASFNTNYETFNNNYSRFNADYADFNQRRTVISNDLSVITADVSAMKAQNVQLTHQLTSINGSLNQVRTDVSSLNQRIRTPRGPGG